MRTPVDLVREFVDAFVAAWPAGDADRLASFFSADAVYCNGPLEPVQSREAIRASLAGFMAMGGEVDVDIIHMVADGAFVLTERVDYFRSDWKTLSLPVMGTFEVRDGLITAWRDYFDLNQFTSQLEG
jgi:limonene-1,2-epoxide hydrolase